MRYALAGLAIWLGTLAVPNAAIAQGADPAPVRIRVIDSFSGDGLAGARVAFPELGLSEETNRAGIASFDAVPSGDREMQASRAGFATASQVRVTPVPLVAVRFRGAFGYCVDVRNTWRLQA